MPVPRPEQARLGKKRKPVAGLSPACQRRRAFPAAPAPCRRKRLFFATLEQACSGICKHAKHMLPIPTKTPARTRLLLVDDHAIVREGLLSLLSREGKYDVAGEAASGGEAVALAEALRPQLMILDMGLPDMDGAAVIGRVKEKGLAVKVVALSMHNDLDTVRHALAAGADAYVLKDALFHELETAIDRVMQGGFYLGQAVQALLRLDGGKQEAARLAGADIVRLLSERELSVLRMIGEGAGRREIAASLGVSAYTVDTYRHRIMAKAGAETAADLLRLALALPGAPTAPAGTFEPRADRQAPAQNDP
jgi:DNA-binding NarL/FixJ family response regulator